SCAGKPVVGRLLPGSVAPRAGPCRLRALHVKPLAVTPERVRLLPVRRVVADLELFVGHAQRDEEADTEQDDRGDHDVPCDDEERAAELFAELSDAAAVEGAARSRDVRVERGEVRGGEEAREDAAEEPGDGVRVEDGEGVVHLLEEVGLLVEDHHGHPRHAAGADAHQYGRPCVHQSCMCGGIILLLHNSSKILLPAPAVMQTSPVIMPCTAPITEGLPKKMTSRQVQVRRLAAALTLVLSTAMDAVMLGAYGAPPLNPAQPSHSSPPPAIMSRMLLGANLSLSLFSLGPTCHEKHKAYVVVNYYT
ncbi:hypothetical protein EJB05_52160, partial [Eragrostis curvula]